MESQYTQRKSGEFTYIDEGEGPVVLILHGLFGSLSNFEELIELSHGRYRFVLPLFPIYDCEMKQSNLEGMLDYLMRFIDFMKLKDFSLLGNSLGGHIALCYELKHPNISRSLILTGSSGLFENSLGSDFPRRDVDTIRQKILEIFGNKAVVTDKIVNEALDIILDYSKILRVLKMAKSAVRQNLTYEIEKIKTQTLLIWGEDDIITPPFVAHQFNEKLVNSQLVFIPKCGHAAMMEYPKEFSEILFPFLEKIYAKDE